MKSFRKLRASIWRMRYGGPCPTSWAYWPCWTWKKNEPALNGRLFGLLQQSDGRAGRHPVQ